MKFRSRFICLFVCFTYGWMFNCFSTIYWKGYPSSIKLFLPFCQISFGYICIGLFLCSSFCSIGPYAYPPLIPHCLDYFRFIINFNIRFSHFNILFKDCFYSMACVFPCKFSISLSISIKKTSLEYYRNCIIPTDQFEENLHLYYVYPYNPWT